MWPNRRLQLGPRWCPPHAAGVATVECPLLSREWREPVHEVVLVAFADVWIGEAVRVVAVGEPLEGGHSPEGRRRPGDRAPRGNLQVIAAALQIDISERLSGADQLPELLDANKEPVRDDRGVLGCVAVVSELSVAEQKCGERRSCLREIRVAEAPRIVGLAGCKPDRDGGGWVGCKRQPGVDCVGSIHALLKVAAPVQARHRGADVSVVGHQRLPTWSRDLLRE